MSVEEYINITDLMAGQKLYINRKEYTADENGSILLSESMLKGEKGSPMEQFEGKLNEVLTDLQKMNLYRMWGRSSAIILSSVINALDGEKTLARKVLALGESCGVLVRGHNYTYKVSTKIMKERMLVLEERLSRALDLSQIEQTGDEYRQSVLNEFTKKNKVVEEEEVIVSEENEENIVSTMNVHETLKQYKSSRPIPITTKTRKTVQSPTKKTQLGKALAISRKTT